MRNAELNAEKRGKQCGQYGIKRHRLCRIALCLGMGGLSLQAMAAYEDFRGPTSTWALNGSATLTGTGAPDPAGDGWLRLTSVPGINQQGNALMPIGEAFATGSTVLFEFEYVTWGSTSMYNNYGGDGISVFLFDSTGSMAGSQYGGGLGYCGGNGAYLGIGLDEWGNFSGSQAAASTGCGDSAPGFITHPTLNYKDSLVLRGPTTATPNNTYVTSMPMPGGVADSTSSIRPEPTQVRMRLDPAMPGYNVTVETKKSSASTWTTLFSNVAFPHVSPANLRIGIAASTGIQNNIHEVRNLAYGLPVDIAVTKTASRATAEVGDTLTYTVTYTNNSAINLTGAGIPELVDILPAVLSGAANWTCTAAGGSVCPGGLGSGNLNVTSGYTLGASSSLTFTIAKTVTGGTCGQNVVNTATGLFPSTSTWMDDVPGNNSASAGFTVTCGGGGNGPIDVPLLGSGPLALLAALMAAMGAFIGYRRKEQ